MKRILNPAALTIKLFGDLRLSIKTWKNWHIFFKVSTHVYPCYPKQQTTSEEILLMP